MTERDTGEPDGIERASAQGGNVLVSGATGLVGSALTPELARRFSSVRVLSRRRAAESDAFECHLWDGIDPGVEAVRGASAVVHLSGEPVFGGLPTAARRERIRHSRIESTRRLVERIGAVEPEARPRVLINASAVGYYGDHGEERIDEETAPGTGFLAELCRDWEAAAKGAESLGVRVVRLRIGIVLSRRGGALALMWTPFALGVGGRLGSGRQLVPWIHLEDLVAVILWALEEPVSGAVNAVAPEPVRNLELTKTLGRVLSRPTLLPVPAFVLRLALGGLAGELLDSRRVVPGRLEAAGFRFRHPSLAEALEYELA